MRGIVFLRILDRLEEIIIASLIGAATLLIFVAVVQRYLIGVPFLYPYFYDFNLTWAQELCIYMFVWMANCQRPFHLTSSDIRPRRSNEPSES